MARLTRPRLLALHGAIVQVLYEAVETVCKGYAGAGQFGEAESFSCFVYAVKVVRGMRPGDTAHPSGWPIQQLRRLRAVE
jgi:hypothetical protein